MEIPDISGVRVGLLWLASVILLSSGATCWAANATYDYVGNDFTVFQGNSGLTTSNFIAASLTFSSSLPPNFTGDPGLTPANNSSLIDAIKPTTWSITDGVHTLSSTNGAFLYDLELETDASGDIVSWHIDACSVSPCQGGSELSTASDDPSAPGVVYDSYSFDYTGTLGDLAYVQSKPGIWMLASPAPPAAPSIAPGGVVPVDSTVNVIQPGEWVSIYGQNLANSIVTWNGNFPTSLGGTSVTINGKPAFLWYVSPAQINLQAPDDSTSGLVPVVVTTANGTAMATVALAPVAPSFLLLDGRHVAGIIPRSDGSGAYGGGSYDILGPTGNSLGYPTVAAKPGDVVWLFAVGLGPVNATAPAGEAFSGAAPTVNPVKLLMNDNYVSVAPAFSGLSSAGLYQINLSVPGGLGAGDFSLVATVGGVQTPEAVISLQAGDVGPGASCANVGGQWNASESGSYTEKISAAIETDTQTNPVNGNGSVTITQTGCTFQYNPISETGLIGLNLTSSQLASATRTGTVSGNNVSVTGLLAVVDTVASAQAGFTITNISTNVMTGSGQIVGTPPVMTLSETGMFAASGTYSRNGQSGSFTETITASSTATFTLGGVITTVAGMSGPASSPPTCFNGASGDGGPATSASLCVPNDVALDANGNLFIADTGNNLIRKVSPNGVITTIAGDGPACNGTFTSCPYGGFSGDGGPATSASINAEAVAVDAVGNLFVLGPNRVRKVSPSGIITTVAGNGTAGFSGDGGPAILAELYEPSAVAVDVSGNVFIADSGNNRIRKVSPSGIITTVAGSGPSCEQDSIYCGGFSGDGGPATSASLHNPNSVAVDVSGNVFISDYYNGRVRKVSTNGLITTVAGNGNPCCTTPSPTQGLNGDGGPATSAALYGPDGVAVDAAGNLFISSGNVYMVSPTGIITTIAGRGIQGTLGDGGPATSADLDSPAGLAVDASGNLFIADAWNSRIREVTLVGAPATTSALRPSEQAGVRLSAVSNSGLRLKILISPY